jgi:hypothetical protein
MDFVLTKQRYFYEKDISFWDFFFLCLFLWQFFICENQTHPTPFYLPLKSFRFDQIIDPRNNFYWVMLARSIILNPLYFKIRLNSKKLIWIQIWADPNLIWSNFWEESIWSDSIQSWDQVIYIITYIINISGNILIIYIR